MTNLFPKYLHSTPSFLHLFLLNLRMVKEVVVVVAFSFVLFFLWDGEGWTGMQVLRLASADDALLVAKERALQK